MPATIQSDVWKQFSRYDDKKSATCKELHVLHIDVLALGVNHNIYI